MTAKKQTLLTLILLSSSGAWSFSPRLATLSLRQAQNKKESQKNLQQTSNDELHPHVTSRRKALLSTFLPISLASVGAMTVSPQPSNARDELFRPNPLTNPILEKIRILEQAEADNIQYGGELAPGSPKGRDAYAKLLVPILTMQKDLIDVDELVHVTDGQGLERAKSILSKSQFEKIPFKKMFNAFADNIYYSDPDRANAYLGGGAVPKNEQSIAYLLRNDVLTNLEALQAEVIYLIKEQKAGNPLETEDLFLYSKLCTDGMVKYLELVPPLELKQAKEYMSSS